MLKTTLIALAALGACLAMGQGDVQGGPPPFQQGPPPAGPGGQGGMRRAPRPGMMGGPGMLMRPDVQKELKLSQDQIDRLREAMPPPPNFGGPGQGGPGQGGPEGGPGRGGQAGPPPPGARGPGQGGPGFRGPRPEDRQLEEKVKGILTETQFARYEQLKLQMRGAGVIGSPEIADKLGLSDDQRGRIREIFENDRPPMPPPLTDGGERPDPQRMRDEMRKHREEIEGKVLAVLTKDQRAKWDAMIGKPFKFEQPPMGPGFRGPGGPGGPGGPPPRDGGGGF